MKYLRIIIVICILTGFYNPQTLMARPKTIITDVISNDDSSSYIIYDLFDNVNFSYRKLGQLKTIAPRKNQVLNIEFYPKTKVKTLEHYYRKNIYVNKERVEAFILYKKSFFDDRGRLTAAHYFSWDNNFEFTTMTFITEYIYNDNDQIVESTGYNNNGQIIFKGYYKYDARGNLSQKETSQSANAKFTFDLNNNLVEYLTKLDGKYIPYYRAKYLPGNKKYEEYYFDTSGAVDSQIFLKLDNKNNIIEEIDEKVQAPVSRLTSYYKYDALNNRIYSETYSGIEKERMLLEDKISYKYNGRMLIEKIHLTEDGQPSKWFKYQYDKNGNLVAMEEFFSDQDVKIPFTKYTARYDLRTNNILEEVNYGQDSTHRKLLQSESIVYRYNKDWYLTDYVKYGAVYYENDLPSILEKTRYIYDEKNNIIQFEWYDANSSLMNPHDVNIFKYNEKFHKKNIFHDSKVYVTPFTPIEKSANWEGKESGYVEDFRD